MILDYMKNYRMYNSLVSNLEEGMTFVNTLLDKPEGRYEAEHGIYAMVQIGVTSDIGKDRMETHEKYLDVQMVFEGRETFEWEEASELEAETEYDPETDFKFYRKENSCHRGHVLYSVSPGRPQVPGNGRERRGKVPQDCAEASGGNEAVSVGLCRYGNLKEKVYVFI